MTDTRVERFNQRLDRHLVERLRREDAAALKLYRTLERTREELFAKLLAFEEKWGTSRTFTPAYLSGILDDINQAMGALRAEASGDLRAQMLVGFQMGAEQTFREVAVWYGGFSGQLAPRVPLDVMNSIIEGQVGLMETTFERLRLRIVAQVREATAYGLGEAEASRRAAATVEEVQARLAAGIARGDGTKSIARRLMAPGDGEFVRLGYREAIMQTRLNLNDAFNHGHGQALIQAKGTVPELRQRWVSALVRSTPVCLCLHGQVAEVGGAFHVSSGFGGTWRGTRPPAIGQGAKPAVHLCRSRVVPDHPDWPENPKLMPLTAADRAHFHQGGDFREVDVARRKVYPGFSPRADRVK